MRSPSLESFLQNHPTVTTGQFRESLPLSFCDRVPNHLFRWDAPLLVRAAHDSEAGSQPCRQLDIDIIYPDSRRAKKPKSYGVVIAHVRFDYRQVLAVLSEHPP
jgi:hypothetical protein